MSLIANILQAVQSELSDQDRADFESSIGPYFRATNFAVKPTAAEFGAIYIRIATIISKIDAVKANSVRGAKIMSMIMTCFSKNWGIVYNVHQDYRVMAHNGYALFEAINRSGFIDGSLPANPILGQQKTRKDEIIEQAIAAHGLPSMIAANSSEKEIARKTRIAIEQGATSVLRATAMERKGAVNARTGVVGTGEHHVSPIERMKAAHAEKLARMKVHAPSASSIPSTAPTSTVPAVTVPAVTVPAVTDRMSSADRALRRMQSKRTHASTSAASTSAASTSASGSKAASAVEATGVAVGSVPSTGLYPVLDTLDSAISLTSTATLDEIFDASASPTIDQKKKGKKPRKERVGE